MELEIDDSLELWTARDTASKALYNNSRLDYIFSGVGEENDAPEQEMEDLSNESKETSEKAPTRRSHYKLLRVIAGAHRGWVRSLKVDPVTNKWFATGSTDSTIKVWDLASLKCKATITGHIMTVRALEISKKYPYLFSGSEDKEVKCFDLERSHDPAGCEIKNYHGHVGGIYAMALHPELDILFTGGRDQAIRCWDIRSRAEIMTLTGHRDDVTTILASETEPQVISSSSDGTIRLWDIRNTKTDLTITSHSKSIRTIAAHPSESTFISADAGGNIKQWLLPQGALLNEMKHADGIIDTLSVNHTNNDVFVGYDDGRFDVVDYITGDLLQSGKTIASPGSNESSIYCSGFDLSGLRLLTGESDHSIKVWAA